MRATLLVVVVMIGGCKGEEQAPHIPWLPHKITEVKLGPFTVPIPAGWRDMAEVDDAQLRSAIPPGSRMLGFEAFSGDKHLANIQLAWPAESGVMTCGEVAAAAKLSGMTVTTTKAIHLGAIPGCRIAFRKSNVEALSVVGFAGDHRLTLTCTHDLAGDAEADKACAAVLASLGVKDDPPVAEYAGLSKDPVLAVGALIDGRYRVLAWLGETAQLSVIAVEHIHINTKATLIAPRSDSSAEVRKAFAAAAMREIGLEQQKQSTLQVDEVDSITGDRRSFVIAKLSPAQIADVLAGRLIIGGK